MSRDIDRMQELQRQTTEHVTVQHQIHRQLKIDEHSNALLERKAWFAQYHQQKCSKRVKHLTGQLATITARHEQREQLIRENLRQAEIQQQEKTEMQLTLKKVIRLNGHLEKILQENRFRRASEQDKLRSIKHLSFQKRKQLIAQSKQLHVLSVGKRHCTRMIIRNSLEITRSRTLFDRYIHLETVCLSVEALSM